MSAAPLIAPATPDSDVLRAAPPEVWNKLVNYLQPSIRARTARTVQFVEQQQELPRTIFAQVSAFAHELPRPFSTRLPVWLRGKRCRCVMNVPLCSSVMACRNSSWVFMTIGPYHATGSSIGLAETNRKRIPSSPA